jgi:hypothetical protein
LQARALFKGKSAREKYTTRQGFPLLAVSAGAPLGAQSYAQIDGCGRANAFGSGLGVHPSQSPA